VSGATSPKKNAAIVPPRSTKANVAVLVGTSIGDYRRGDELWCETLSDDRYVSALNRDVLVPRSGERFIFGRLINRDSERLQVLPLEPGARQQVVANPPWLAVVSTLIRRL
jgi:hypothetical protein